MYLDYRKIKLFVIPGFVMVAMLLVAHLVIGEMENTKAKEKLFQVLVWLFYYLFFVWQFAYEKKWRHLLFTALLMVAANAIYFFDNNLYHEDYGRKEPTKWYYVYSLFFSWTSVFGLYYGVAKGKSVSSGIRGYIVGVSMHAIIEICRRMFFGFDYYEHWTGYVIYCMFLFGHGFAYYYLLNIYSEKRKYQISFSDVAKKYPVRRTGFALQFIVLYTLLFFMIYALVYVSKPRSSFFYTAEEIKLKWFEWLFYIFYIVGLFTVLHALSNILIQKLYAIKRPIGFTYFFAFVPVINIFILVYLLRNKNHRSHLEAVYNGSAYARYLEEDAGKTYKTFMIIIVLLFYMVSAYSESRTGTRLQNTIVIGFLLVNAGFLIAFYHFKMAWVGLLVSLFWLTFFKFYLKMDTQLEIVVAMVSALMQIYLFAQSFHPISLDFSKIKIENRGLS